MTAGFDPARFWTITPREVDRELRAAHRRREIDADERMSLAWHVEAFARTKKLPKLQDIIGKKSRQRQRSGPQSPDEQLANMKTLFIAWGGDKEDLKTLQ